MSHAVSPFLAVPQERRIAESDLVFAIYDGYPVSPGHVLIVPFRCIATWFEATDQEWVAALELVSRVKALLDTELHPDGYNVGFNAGEAAGQTVFHAHIHVIPRYMGDVENPAGGVRHAVLGRGYYQPQPARAHAR